ncbi:uncharacterized protein [Diadema antillarum]|uniref:uncharacterized protein n=1 Tax=Diadema antillarum TaxID=105358 RepID=UPI003A84ED7A
MLFWWSGFVYLFGCRVECRCADSCLGLFASKVALMKEIDCLQPFSATYDIPWRPDQTTGMVEWTKPHQNVERPYCNNRWEQIWCYIKDYGPGIRYVRVWFGQKSVCSIHDCQMYRVAGGQVMALLKEDDVPDTKCLQPRGKTAKRGRKRNAGRKRAPTLKLQEWPSSAFDHPFTHRNLIKNGSAQDSHGNQEMQNWVVTANGGEGWTVGKKSEDETYVPSQLEQTEGRGETFFCTSSEWCAREQVIDLLAEGFTEDFLDEVQPPIFVSTWYAGQFDCGTEYQMSAELLRNPSPEGNSLIDSRQSGTLSTKAGEWRWRRIFYCFEDYQPGLRFIRFSDRGRGTDTEGGAGHLGAKVTGAEVRFVSPKTVYECYSASH